MYISRIPCFSYNLLFYLKARFSPTLSERPIMTLSSNCCQCASSLKVKNDNVYVYKRTLCINDNKRSLLITYAPHLNKHYGVHMPLLWAIYTMGSIMEMELTLIHLQVLYYLDASSMTCLS